MTDEPTVAALRAEIERKERDAGVLQAFTAELNTTLVLDELLSIVLHTVNEVFGFNHAMVLEALGRNEETVELLNAILKSRPDYWKARQLLDRVSAGGD